VSATDEAAGGGTVPSREDDLRVRLKWLLLLRVAVVSSLLVALALLQYSRSEERLEASLPYLQILGGGVYIATIAYALSLWRARGARLLALVQLAGDVLLVTALIHVTGGIDSGFSFLYLLTIIVGAILFSRSGAYGMAAACTLSYGALLAAQAIGWMHAPPLFVNPVWKTAPGEVAANVAFNAAVFFVVALLSGYLADQLRATSEQLREKEQDLARLRNLTTEIVASMGSGLLTVDGEERITFVNPTGAQIIGVTGSVLGRPLREVLSTLPEHTRHGAVRRFEILHRRPDGETLLLGCSFSHLERQPGSRILIFQDLTEVKMAEERARSNERLAAVGRLSAGMAHEIRNPIASIRGSIEMLGRELALSGDQGRLMQIILRETDRLNALISDFLQFARPPETKRQPVALAGLLAETADTFSCRGAGEPPIDLRIEVPTDLLLDADPAQLRQVIWNLLLNARDAMPEGGHLQIAARRGDGPVPDIAQGISDESRRGRKGKTQGEWAVLRFEDGGVGIPPDVLPRIFEPFFTTKERGTGLGLAMVYRIVEGHGGAVEVESEPRRGTVFTVWLPVYEPVDPTREESENLPAAADRNEGRV
jgi:two-component system sensor histidine kinase PilS (NtrC family)